MTRQEIEDRKNALASVILDREAKLKEHDYVSAKIADGRATIDEYADVIAQKTAWAKEINDAYAEIASLEGINKVPSDDFTLDDTPEDDDQIIGWQNNYGGSTDSQGM